MLDAVSSKLDACCSVRLDRSLLPEEISPAAVLIVSPASRTCTMTSVILSIKALTPSHKLAMAPVLPSSETRLVKSPALAPSIMIWVSSTASTKAAAVLCCSVISVAYFTTLKWLAVQIHNRVIASLQPYFFATFGDTFVLTHLRFATVKRFPKSFVLRTTTINRLYKHAMMITDDFIFAIACDIGKIVIYRGDLAGEIKFNHPLDFVNGGDL